MVPCSSHNNLRRVGSIALAFALAVACAAQPSKATQDAERDALFAVTARKAREAVVLVHPAPGHTGGSGAGFVFTPDGHILTNAHIVDDMSGIEVIFSDGKRLPARLVGLVADKNPDVAVLKVDSDSPFAALSFGEPPEQGDAVLAIGHPAMVSFWVPIKGEVVGFGRESVRVDMPSFYGMSGAPLLDLTGSVVGLIFGTRVPRVESATPGPLQVINSWEEFGRLKPPVSAATADAVRTAVDRILQAQP